MNSSFNPQSTEPSPGGSFLAGPHQAETRSAGDRRAELMENLRRVRQRIAVAGGADLLPITKFHPASDIALLRHGGIHAVGENREQEAKTKHAELGGDPLIHMVGQIQSKKANSVARWAAAVHTVDSSKLVASLERGVALAQERGERDNSLPVLLQFSADGDPQRGGATEDLIDALADEVASAPHLELRGLMCVPPLGVTPGPVFRRGREMLERIADRVIGTPVYSAGMSNDLEIAIAEGSTLVRVGTDIMGPRPVP